MRTLRVIRAFVALLVAWLALGCDRRPPPPAADSASPPLPPPAASPAASPRASASVRPTVEHARPFLYRVTGDRGGGWLFGTVHLGADAAEVLHPAVFRELRRAKTMVLELDLDAMDAGAMMTRLMQPPGKSLEDQLTPAQWQKLPDLVGPFVPTASLARLKPAAAYSLILARMLPTSEPMDAALQAEGRRAGVAFVYLETADEQLSILDRVITAEVLGHDIDDHATMRANLDRMLTAYREGDEAGLTRGAFDPELMKEHPQLYEELFYERNEAWAKKLDPLLKEGDVFVAVGAGHLLGPRSVNAMLTELGWKVARVPDGP